MFRNVSTAPKPASSSNGASNGSPPKQGAFNGSTVTPSGQRYRPMDDPVFTSTWQSRIYPQHQEYFIHDKQGKPTVRADCQAQAQSAYIEYRLQRLETNRLLPIIRINGEEAGWENTVTGRQERIQAIADMYCEHPHIERVTDRELVEAFPPPSARSLKPKLAWEQAIFESNRDLFTTNSDGVVVVKHDCVERAKRKFLNWHLLKIEQDHSVVNRALNRLLVRRNFELAYSEAEKKNAYSFIGALIFDKVITDALHYDCRPDDLTTEYYVGRLDLHCQNNIDRFFHNWQVSQHSVGEALPPPTATPTAPPLVDANSLDAPLNDREKFLLIKGLVKDLTKNGLQPFLEYSLAPTFAMDHQQLYELITQTLVCGEDEPIKRTRINEVCKRILKLIREDLSAQYYQSQEKPINSPEFTERFAKSFWQVCAKEQIHTQLCSIQRDPNAPPSFAFAVAQ